MRQLEPQLRSLTVHVRHENSIAELQGSLVPVGTLVLSVIHDKNRQSAQKGKTTEHESDQFGLAGHARLGVNPF